MLREPLAIAEASRVRLAGPAPPNPMADKTLHELLTLANDNTQHSEHAKEFWGMAGELDGEGQFTATAFNEPASASEIAALEARLGVTLPSDYKAFLRITNGFDQGWTMGGIFTGWEPDPALYSVDKVCWRGDKGFAPPIELLCLPSEIEQLAPNRDVPGDNSFNSPLPPADATIVIADQQIHELCLVPPALVADARAVYDVMLKNATDEQKRVIARSIDEFAGSRAAFDRLEWCCLQWHAGGVARITPYSSFRDYLEKATIGSTGGYRDEEYRT